MSASVGRRLEAVHSGMADFPLPEWLEGASCGPAVKHLVHLAMHTSDAGGSEADWRGWVSEHVPDASAELMSEAEDCMRSAGLWPWSKRATHSRS